MVVGNRYLPCNGLRKSGVLDEDERLTVTGGRMGETLLKGGGMKKRDRETKI